MKTIELSPLYARRWPDPLNAILGTNIHHHSLVCRAKGIPKDFPLDPNPREQDISRSIYKDIKDSLNDKDDPKFHLKNRGITVLARAVDLDESKQKAVISFSEGDGIVDGGHTYRIVCDSQESVPENQFVEFRVRTGVPSDYVESIADGLNTSVQVSQMSLDNLTGKFNWIKEELDKEPYGNLISYKENQDGAFDARDLVALLTLFNLELFPGEDQHPKIAYTAKGECLRRFSQHPSGYQKLRPLLRNILQLHDLIHLEARELYNKKYGGSGGRLCFYAKKERGEYDLIFINQKSQYILHDGALVPILGALRCLIVDKGETYGWRLSSFGEVVSFVREILADFIAMTKQTAEGNGRNPNKIGKDEGHWRQLYLSAQVKLLKLKMT